MTDTNGSVLRVVLVTGKGLESQEMRAGDPPMTIGRKEGENSFVVRDEQGTVSRRHAVIEHTAEGFRIRDLGSRNGVRVQGRAVAADGVLLGDGDEIQLGLAVLRASVVPNEATVAVSVAAVDGERTIVDAHPARPPVAKPPAPSPPRAATTPPPPPPPERAAAPVIDRYGSFEVHRSEQAGNEARLDFATDTRSGRTVLIRRLQGLELGFFARRRFHRAYEVARDLRHECLLVPLEVGAAGGDPYVVYPGSDGASAGTLIRLGGKELRIDVAVYVAREVCTALDFLANRLGPRHRPCVTDHVVWIGQDGRVRLLYVPDDPSQRGERYGAPEEDAGETGDARSAVFSVGILVYELLAREPIDPAQKLMLPSIDTRRIQVGPELARSVMRALEVRPGDRFAHAKDFGRELGAAFDQLTLAFSPAQVGAWVASRFAQ